MIDKSLLILFLFWYSYTYGIPPFLFNLYFRLHNLFTYYKDFSFSSIYWFEDFEDVDNDKKLHDNVKEIDNNKEPVKYEDKYLHDIRVLNKEWVFTEEENNSIPILVEDFFNKYKETRLNRIEEINEQIKDLENEISKDTDFINYIEDLDEDGAEVINENTLEQRNEERQKQILLFQEEYQTLKVEIETDEGIENLKNISQNEAIKYIINKRIDKLENCYIIEKTPIGNVLMIYDKTKETFKYYSDCNIPYRYLEVVGRKYVKVFDCRPIFVDMEEELRLFEEKWEKEQQFKKLKEEEEKRLMEELTKNKQPVEIKKNVFAKFKSYNKDAGGKISMAAPPKNSIPNKNTKENEKILLKERANRYTYEGKFANFNFLKKIERKVFNKKLGLSFADFKKMKK